jgi:hypothetical protein
VSTTTIVLIIAAVAVVAIIAFFALRGPRPDAVGVAADANDDPALSASGEAMIVGDVMIAGDVMLARDVMPIDSNEPAIPPGTAQPPRDSLRAGQSRREPLRAGQPTPSRPSEPSRQSELVEDGATNRDIRWAKRFEPRDGAFDDATRLNLIRDLGIVRAPWGVPLLTQAYEEEPAAEHRRAALRALAAYRHPDTQSVFEAALRSDDDESRAIAATSLRALEIRASLPS